MSVDCATLHDDKAALGDISKRLAELFDTFFESGSVIEFFNSEDKL